MIPVSCHHMPGGVALSGHALETPRRHYERQKSRDRTCPPSRHDHDALLCPDMPTSGFATSSSWCPDLSIHPLEEPREGLTTLA